MTNVSTRPVALRTIIGAAAVIAALLAFVPAANAARDPISGGTTDLHLKKGFIQKLTNLGVGLAGVGTGSVNGGAIHLPVTEGSFDPTTAQGHIDSPGGFQLVRGARTVPISGVEANTVHGFLRATIAGAHMQLGTFSGPTIGREGFGARVKAGQLVLTQKAATRISNKLGLQGSQRINSRVMSNEFNITVPSQLTIIPSGEATFSANTKTFGKFAEKGINVTTGIKPIAPAKNSKVTQFTFPLGGGTLATNYTAGTIATTGGVEIIKNGKVSTPTMRLNNIVVEFATKTASAELEVLPAPGAAGRQAIVTLNFPANSITANPTTRQVTVKGAEALLSATAAVTLNNTFNMGEEKAPPASSDFVAGDPFGTFSMVLQAQ
jgi:hypothetical protein